MRADEDAVAEKFRGRGNDVFGGALAFDGVAEVTKNVGEPVAHGAIFFFLGGEMARVGKILHPFAMLLLRNARENFCKRRRDGLVAAAIHLI